MKAKKRGLKEFVIEFSGSGDVVVFAKDKENALQQFARMSNRRLFEAMDVEFDVTEEVDNHG